MYTNLRTQKNNKKMLFVENFAPDIDVNTQKNAHTFASVGGKFIK